MSILIACVMVLGTLSAACLPVRAEEENSAAVPAETVREAEPEAAAPETAEAQPGETVSDAGREDGAAPAAAPEAASAQSEEAVSDSSREDGPEASAAPETAESGWDYRLCICRRRYFPGRVRSVCGTHF